MTQIDPQLHGLPKLGEGLYFARLFWLDGQSSKAGKGGGAKSEVNSGVPCNGWSSAFVIDKGQKLVTIFCPYTYEGFQVTRTSFEFTGLKQPWWPSPPREADALGESLRKLMLSQWEDCTRKGWQRDYDVAAVVIKLLGLDVPMGMVKEGQEVKVSGGKEVSVALTKPVKQASRKGQVLAFFWPETKSIRECMAEMGITRSNVLSQLYLLQKDHGIGYELKGDAAIITMPAGVDSPWAEAA